MSLEEHLYLHPTPQKPLAERLGALRPDEVVYSAPETRAILILFYAYSKTCDTPFFRFLEVSEELPDASTGVSASGSMYCIQSREINHTTGYERQKTMKLTSLNCQCQ